MRVSNLSPGQLPAPVEMEGQANAAAPVQSPPQGGANTPGLQVQLLIHEALETLLSNLGGTVENSQLLLEALPDALQQEVRQILQQAAPDAGTISRGMSTLVQMPKMLAEQLQNIVQTLQGTLYLEEQLTPDAWNTLTEKTETVLAAIRQNPPRLSPQTAPPAVTEDILTTQATQANAQNKPVEPQKVESGVWRQTMPQNVIGNVTEPGLPATGDGVDPGQAAKPVPTAAPKVPLTAAEPLTEVNQSAAPLTGKPATDWTAKALQLVATNEQDQTAIPAAIRQLTAEFQTLPAAEQTTAKQALLTLLSRPVGEGDTDIQALLVAVRQRQAEQTRSGGDSRTLLPEPATGEAVGKVPVPVNATAPGIGDSQATETWTAATVAKLAKATLDDGEVPDELRSVRLETLDLTAAERQELQKAVLYLQDFLPQTVKQAAVAHSLPELPDLWMLFKFSEASKWKELPSETLHKAIRTIQELSTAVQDSLASLPEKTDTANTMSFTVPLYFGDGNTVYPAYVRIYHERQGTGASKREAQPETWLRIFFDTNHLGRVDAMFHLYQGNLLSVRTEFSNDEAAGAFRDIVAQVRSALGELPLTLTDFSVRIIPGETVTV